MNPDQITQYLHHHYDIKAITLTPLSLGADSNASVYRADTGDQQSYFVKLKRGKYDDTSIEIIKLLHHAGISQIILPVKTTEGDLAQRIGDFTLIVYPFIEGENGFCRILTNEQWLTLGKVCRQIHEMQVPLSLQHRIRRETYSPAWREKVRSLYSHINAEPFGDETARKLLAFMKEKINVIYQLVDQAEHFAQIVERASPVYVLCHSDIHAGNVVIDNKNNLYIVDWDSPVMAPKERDFMFIGGGVGNVWNKTHEESLFYKGYGKAEIDMTLLAYYRYERIVEDIALYGQDILLTSGKKDRLEMYGHFVAMFEPNGVIDIAFKTGKALAV